jgi:rhodanese-related sulfurtransferase
MKTEMIDREPAEARHFFANKIAFTTDPVELNRRIQRRDQIAIFDVREPEDYLKAHIPGAVNLPKARWQETEGLRRDTINVLYCYSAACHLAASAAVELAGRGFPVMEMDGGFEAWEENQLPVER